MKTIKILLFSFILIASQGVYAQSKSDKMYDVFSGKDGVLNLSFSKNMIDAININIGDNDEKKVTGDLHQVRFMSYNPEKGNLSGSEFLKKAVSLLPSAYKKYEDEDGDSDTEIWLLGRKKKFTECHVFINNDNEDGMRFIVSFYGDFNVNNLDGLKNAGKDFSDEE